MWVNIWTSIVRSIKQLTCNNCSWASSFLCLHVTTCNTHKSMVAGILILCSDCRHCDLFLSKFGYFHSFVRVTRKNTNIFQHGHTLENFTRNLDVPRVNQTLWKELTFNHQGVDEPEINCTTKKLMSSHTEISYLPEMLHQKNCPTKENRYVL